MKYAEYLFIFGQKLGRLYVLSWSFDLISLNYNTYLLHVFKIFPLYKLHLMLGRKKIGHYSFRRSGGPPLTRSISLKYTESKNKPMPALN